MVKHRTVARIDRSLATIARTAWKTPGPVKTRTLLILAAVAGIAIIGAFTIQLLTDSRFLG